MHTHSLERWQYDHNYLPRTQRRSERRTRLALALTVVMMVVELAAGYATGSLALTADGWHMGSHAAALGISAFAYAFSRHHVANARFTFGTGKVGPLAGYTSALVLAFVALTMVWQSAARLLHPVSIGFNEAILVAALGLIVNLACALILAGGDGHHDHEHAAEGHAHRHDHNLRSAYLHVLADAVTSILAIVALVSGKYLGWTWMDALMGIAGAAIIGQWCASLLRSSAHVLLDAEDNDRLVADIAQRIEGDADNRIADLHVWRLGPLSHGCIVSLVTHEPRPAAHYKALLADIRGLEHVTVEVNQCCADCAKTAC
ncbi:MAG TPA: CDF family Co(II)/Ni(II) efflux transporter DmeF [Burkholderiales bacterium]|nr:CDF family Co(II)/Ni(II) efflux transporter DmeF [Burkholderiales bacterium]